MELSEELIAVCAGGAALATDGVAGLAGGIKELLSRNLLGKELLSRGVRVSQSDDGISIDISVFVRYGVKIPEVAWDLQENVKRAVEEKIGHQAKVKAVNVRVQGVEPAEQKAASAKANLSSANAAPAEAGLNTKEQDPQFTKED